MILMTIFRDSLAGLGQAVRNIPERVGEEVWRKLTPKVRFYEEQECCNWLDNMNRLLIGQPGALAQAKCQIFR